jgi:hypothetical protein
MNRSPLARDTNPNYVYSNIQITNIESNTVSGEPVYYNQSRSTPLIQNCGDYEFCITRFSLNTKNSLPTFQPAITPNATSPNSTIYSITFVYGGVTYQQYLEWQPQDMSQSVPIPPSENGGIQVNSAYYYAYSYNWLPILVQNLLSSAFAAFEIQCTNADVVLPVNSDGVTPTPTIVFDSNTGISTLYFDQACFDTFVGTNVIQLYFNASMAALFSFPYIKYGSSQTGQNYLVMINSQGVSTTELPTTADAQYAAVIVPEEYSSLASQNPIATLAFTSGTLPIVSTQICPSVLTANGQSVTTYSASSDAFVNEITDFIVSNGVYLPFLVYEPTVLRFISMVGNNPLSSFDFSIYWKNKVGLYTPMILSSGSCVTLKVLFRKKGTEAQPFELDRFFHL